MTAENGHGVNSEPVWLRHTEAAARAGMSDAYLYKLVADGQGPRRVKIGGRVLYKATELDEWIAGR
jgi:excisionase family DNA binding protein